MLLVLMVSLLEVLILDGNLVEWGMIGWFKIFVKLVVELYECVVFGFDGEDCNVIGKLMV